MEEAANQQNMDDMDSISCQVLNRKRSHDDESRLPSKKRSRTIASSFLPSPSCNTFANQGEFTPFPENNYKVDCQLAEELLGCVTPNEGNSCNSNPVRPVPLLTPPASPMPIKSDESIVEIYEWPSNLAVDNALTAVTQLRALSPSSLAKLEDDSRQDGFVFSLYPRKVRSVTKDFTTM